MFICTSGVRLPTCLPLALRFIRDVLPLISKPPCPCIDPISINNRQNKMHQYHQQQWPFRPDSWLAKSCVCLWPPLTLNEQVHDLGQPKAYLEPIIKGNLTCVERRLSSSYAKGSRQRQSTFTAYFSPLPANMTSGLNILGNDLTSLGDLTRRWVTSWAVTSWGSSINEEGNNDEALLVVGDADGDAEGGGFLACPLVK